MQGRTPIPTVVPKPYLSRWVNSDEIMPEGNLFVPIQAVLTIGMITSLTCLIVRLLVRRRLGNRLYPEDGMFRQSVRWVLPGS